MQTNKNDTRPEILAPAGGPEQLTAAVLCGADAVYFGVQGFNARASAKNFTLENLPETVAYCHLHGTKVYLTLNTLVMEDEMPLALKTAQKACECGVDALIVQDLGLAKRIHEAAPDMALHASTQISIHTADGANLLKDYGFTRVVLARELTKSELQTTVKDSLLQTEVFLHGALCMSLSGQCYFSAVAGGRSGNRGRCAQPCRLPFFAKGEQGYALSLKDMSYISRMDELSALGVHAFKIEGRMKRPEYVAAAVLAAKAALNGEKPDLSELQAVFSRSGFTDGYFTSKMGAAMFGVRQKEDVVAATPEILKKYQNTYHKETGLCPVSLVFTAKKDEPISLVLTDENGAMVQVQGEAAQTAQNKPTTEEMARVNLQKLGGTPFFAKETKIFLDEGLMIPVSQLNGLRREAVQKLSALRETPKPVAFSLSASKRPEVLPNSLSGRRPFVQIQLLRPERLPDAGWDAAERVIVPLHALDTWDPGKYAEKTAVALPAFLVQQTELQEKLRAAKEKGVHQVFTGNLGGILPAKRLEMQVHGDFSLNITNADTLLRVKELGLSSALLSVEMLLSQCVNMPVFLPRGIFAYGRIPMMRVRNCPAALSGGCQNCGGMREMTDRGGRTFLVDCTGAHDGGHRYGAQIYNFRPVYLGDRREQLNGLDFIHLFFSDESSQDILDILQAYESPTEKRENITRGLYYRGVE